MPEQNFSRSITGKLIVLVILFSSLITFITTAFQLYRDYDQSLEALHGSFDQMEKAHLPSIEEATWNLDLKQLKTLLDGIVALQDIRYAEIRDKGRMLASSGARVKSNSFHEQYNLTFLRGGAQVSIGVLTIEADLSAIYERLIDRIGLILLSNGIKTFFVALFISFIFGYLVSRHLTSIAAHTKRFSPKDEAPDLRLDRPTSPSDKTDELDHLVSSINEMQADIVQSRRALMQSHDELESLVKKRTAELSQSETLLKAAQSIANIGSWQWNISTGEEIWSDELFRIYGRDPDGLPVTYDDFLAAVHPEDKSMVLAAAEQALGGDRNYDHEYRIVRPTGEVRYVHARAELTRDSHGNPESMLGTAHDITKQKQSEQQHRDVLENLADGAITIDEKGIINFVNATTELIFGYSAEEMIGNNVSMLMAEPERSEHDEYLARYSRTGKSKIIGVGREVQARHKNGIQFPADLNVSEQIVDGNVTYFGTIRDMTERVKGERELLEAKLEAESSNRVKTEFLANMSHELRTPLNAIIGFSETLSAEVFGPLSNPKQEEYLQNIYNSGQHLLNLINDILDVSAIEADKLEFHETDVDLGQTVQASLLLVKPRADKGQVQIRNGINGATNIIRADERRMKQVLVNLLSNAVKFTNSGGLVEVSSRSHEDGSRTILVSDNGIGMSAKEISVAMEPFRQVHRNNDADAYINEGTGLGLPLTLKLIEAQGGKMMIESQPDVGTTVSVRFPADRVIS